MDFCGKDNIKSCNVLKKSFSFKFKVSILRNFLLDDYFKLFLKSSQQKPETKGLLFNINK